MRRQEETMRAFRWVMHPASRVLDRLTALLRNGDSRTAFVTGGEALAAGLLATRGGIAPSLSATQLADAMVGSLLIVDRGTADDEDADRRVRLALATTVLSVARPHTARFCDGIVSIWLGLGLGSVRKMENPYALAGRVLLALLRNDADDASDAVDALIDIDRTGVGGILHDWVVARLQGHGNVREAACFHALRLSLSQTPGGGEGAALLIVGAAVVVERAGRPRSAVLDWLDAIAEDVETLGTTARAAG